MKHDITCASSDDDDLILHYHYRCRCVEGINTNRCMSETVLAFILAYASYLSRVGDISDFESNVAVR
jgi:hypothetical protein